MVKYPQRVCMSCPKFMSSVHADPHPTCPMCRRHSCTREDTCGICALWSEEQWARFNARRKYKMRKKKTVASPGAQVHASVSNRIIGEKNAILNIECDSTCFSVSCDSTNAEIIDPQYISQDNRILENVHPYMCSFCSKTYFNRHDLVKHEKSCSNFVSVDSLETNPAFGQRSACLDTIVANEGSGLRNDPLSDNSFGAGNGDSDVDNEIDNPLHVGQFEMDFTSSQNMNMPPGDERSGNSNLLPKTPVKAGISQRHESLSPSADVNHLGQVINVENSNATAFFNVEYNPTYSSISVDSNADAEIIQPQNFSQYDNTKGFHRLIDSRVMMLFDRDNLQVRDDDRTLASCDVNQTISPGDTVNLQKNQGKDSDMGGYECEICGKRYAIKRSLTRHRVLHRKDNPNICPFCFRKFLSPYDVRKHIERCKMKLERYRKAPSMTANFDNTADDFDCRYPVDIDSSDQIIACQDATEANSLCNEDSSSENFSILDGNASVNPGEKINLLGNQGEKAIIKRYSCEICGNKYALEICLIRHMAIHSLANPNICPFCFKRFCSSDDVSRHTLICRKASEMSANSNFSIPHSYNTSDADFNSKTVSGNSSLLSNNVDDETSQSCNPVDTCLNETQYINKENDRQSLEGKSTGETCSVLNKQPLDYETSHGYGIVNPSGSVNVQHESIGTQDDDTGSSFCSKTGYLGDDASCPSIACSDNATLSFCDATLKCPKKVHKPMEDEGNENTSFQNDPPLNLKISQVIGNFNPSANDRFTNILDWDLEKKNTKAMVTSNDATLTAESSQSSSKKSCDNLEIEGMSLPQSGLDDVGSSIVRLKKECNTNLTDELQTCMDADECEQERENVTMIESEHNGGHEDGNITNSFDDTENMQINDSVYSGYKDAYVTISLEGARYLQTNEGVNSGYKDGYTTIGLDGTVNLNSNEGVNEVNSSKKAAMKYKCEICSKKYATRASLNRHKMIHRLDNPNICPYCSKRFCCWSDVRKHIVICKKAPEVDANSDFIDLNSFVTNKDLSSCLPARTDDLEQRIVYQDTSATSSYFSEEQAVNIDRPDQRIVCQDDSATSAFCNKVLKLEVNSVNAALDDDENCSPLDTPLDNVESTNQENDSSFMQDESIVETSTVLQDQQIDSEHSHGHGPINVSNIDKNKGTHYDDGKIVDENYGDASITSLRNTKHLGDSTLSSSISYDHDVDVDRARLSDLNIGDDNLGLDKNVEIDSLDTIAYKLREEGLASACTSGVTKDLQATCTVLKEKQLDSKTSHRNEALICFVNVNTIDENSAFEYDNAIVSPCSEIGHLEDSALYPIVSYDSDVNDERVNSRLSGQNIGDGNVSLEKSFEMRSLETIAYKIRGEGNAGIYARGFTKNLQAQKMADALSKPHFCHLCSKSYSSGPSLKRHQMRHREDNPHVCPFCKHRFGDAYDLRRHKLKSCKQIVYDFGQSLHIDMNGLEQEVSFPRTERESIREDPLTYGTLEADNARDNSEDAERVVPRYNGEVAVEMDVDAGECERENKYVISAYGRDDLVFSDGLERDTKHRHTQNSISSRNMNFSTSGIDNENTRTIIDQCSKNSSVRCDPSSSTVADVVAQNMGIVPLSSSTSEGIQKNTNKNIFESVALQFAAGMMRGHSLYEHVEDPEHFDSTNSYDCSKCDQNFPGLVELIAHMEAFHEGKCNSCHRSFRNFYALYRHEKQKICCKVTAEEETRLLSHKDAHSFNCLKCFQSFKDHRSLRRHMDVHNPDSFWCKHCGRKTDSAVKLKRHIKIHKKKLSRKKGTSRLQNVSEKGVNIDDGRCLQIQTPVTSFEKVERGIGYACSQCDESFTGLLELISHMEVLHECKCFRCHRSFRSFYALYNHENLKTCSRKTVVEGARLPSQKNTKPFKCLECFRSYQDKYSLRRHMNLHRPDNPYRCKLCGQDTDSGIMLKRHMKRHEKKLSRKPGNSRLQSTGEVVDQMDILDFPLADNSTNAPLDGFNPLADNDTNTSFEGFNPLADNETNTSLDGFRPLADNDTNPPLDVSIDGMMDSVDASTQKDRNQNGEINCILEKPETENGSLEKNWCPEHIQKQIIIVTCNICERSFKNHASMYGHWRTHKSATPKTREQLTCNVCGKIFNNYISLYEHKRIHKNNKTSGKEKSSLHVQQKENKKVTLFGIRCIRCDKGFQNYAVLRKHRKKGNCCGQKGKMANHQLLGDGDCGVQKQNVEKGDFVQATDKAGTFNRPDVVASHEQVTCNVCGKSFKNFFSLYGHSRIHNIDTSSVKEEDYGAQKQIREMSDFVQSTDKAGTFNKPDVEASHEQVTCKVCGKNFKNFRSLCGHQRMHKINKSSVKKKDSLHVQQQSREIYDFVGFTNEAGTLNMPHVNASHEQ